MVVVVHQTVQHTQDFLVGIDLVGLVVEIDLAGELARVEVGHIVQAEVFQTVQAVGIDSVEAFQIVQPVVQVVQVEIGWVVKCQTGRQEEVEKRMVD